MHFDMWSNNCEKCKNGWRKLEFAANVLCFKMKPAKSSHMQKLLGFCLTIAFFPVILIVKCETVINVCSENTTSANSSEIGFWTDFATSFNISYESLNEPNCSSTSNELHKIPYNLSESWINPFSPEGHLQLQSQHYEFTEYCVENISETEISVELCHKKPTWEEECPGNGSCIRKCCGNNAIFIPEPDGSFKCINSSAIWSPTFYESADSNENIWQNFSQISQPIRFITSHPREEWCKFGPYILDTVEYSLRILKNGDVIVKNQQLQPWRLLQPGSFCVDGILRNGSEIVNSEDDMVIVDCSPPDDYEEEQVDQLLYIIFRSVACTFLILTVFVYLVLWEKQNIHSWTLLAYAISMLFLHLSIFATYIHNDRVFLEEESDPSSGDWSCKFLAITSHFLYLTTFCWLTLINFDVWWTFKNLALTTGRSRRKRRFTLYIIFAVLLPMVVISIGFLLKKLFAGADVHIVYLEYSALHCFISDYSALVFKFLPVATLLGCNVILFIMTVVTLYRIGESTKFATNKSSQSDTEKSKFLLFVKLFFVMGLVWILELVSYFVFGRESTHPIAYVLDVMNILQPVAIFIIFVCKADIFRGLQLKLPCLRSLFTMLGLQNLRTRIGSGLSSASVATQMSTASTRSNCSNISGNQVSFEMMGEPRPRP